MRRPGGALAAVVIATAVPLVAAVGPYPDDPPPATTGGFGEPTCASCHMAASVPDSSGSLDIGGLPASYEPGSRYELRIVLARAEMELAGFELSARFADGEDRGTQAGDLHAVDERSAVTESAGIQYAHQVAPGTSIAEPGRAAWRIAWKAPSDAAGRVVFHIASNAANGDGSPLGDHIFSLELAIDPQVEPLH